MEEVIKKENNTQPKVQHKVAADDMIRQALETGKVNKGQALAKAGYALTVQHNPKLVTESKGFKDYMASHGLTEDNLASMLVADLNGKEGNRLGEMKLAAELMGLMNKDLNLNVRQVDEGLELMRSILDGKEDE